MYGAWRCPPLGQVIEEVDDAPAVQNLHGPKALIRLREQWSLFTEGPTFWG